MRRQFFFSAIAIRNNIAQPTNSIWVGTRDQDIGAIVPVLQWRSLVRKMGEDVHSGEGNGKTGLFA